MQAMFPEGDEGGQRPNEVRSYRIRCTEMRKILRHNRRDDEGD